MRILCILLLLSPLIWAQTLPCPFSRKLQVESPLLNGDDVFILQKLVKRTFNDTVVSRHYDPDTAAIVTKFQQLNKLAPSGVFDAKTAEVLLKMNTYDGYKDNHNIPAGAMYKVHVPVYRDRSIETTATLFAGNGTVLRKFTVRTHGQNDDSTGLPLNQFCGDGYTPTGLMSFDLNSPEPDPISYGPYPINRAVQGLLGNAAIVISDIRDGILMHTGEWSGWNDTMPMPNSHGCIHGHPQDIDAVWKLLVSLGVEIRKNTYGQLPYPYTTQGVLSIEQID